MEYIKIKLRTIKIVSLVFCGCETWSVTSSEERRLRVFENRVPRKIFELKRVKVTGDRRKLHDESFSDCVFMYF